ncbi:hypothetical protein ACH5A3_17305 [Streptomyces echinatus]|uniref:hypothetical protein n=1 Tax=Streptomyces echinatus TaxID=67293 RepID=UPI00378D5BFD
MSITDNSGSGPLPGEAVPVFDGDQVSGPLNYAGNEPGLTQIRNTVDGPRSGQCR